MKISYTSRQLTFDEMKGSLSSLPKDNQWVRLGDTLPWDELDRLYLRKLHNDTCGAKNKPSRMVIGAMIIKHKKDLSDEATIREIQENPYMQYMLGLTEYTYTPVFDASLFVTIRKRLTIEDINAFTLELSKRSTRQEDKDDDNPAKTQSTDIKVDATCSDAEVKHPTDCGLLDDASRFIKRMLQKTCSMLGEPVPRNNCSMIHAKYLHLVKLKHKGKKVLRETLCYMLGHIHKDIMTVMELMSRVWNRLSVSDKRTMAAVAEVYRQQEYMFRTESHTCPNRIVSIFQPHIRPIVRGKVRSKVEFGAKIGVSVVGGYTYIDHHSWDAYNESSDFDTHISLFRERFGTLPQRFFADKIYMTKENRRKLKELDIACMGERLGRPPKVKPQKQAENERIGRSLRNEVEATFGTTKRIYRGNNIRARLPKTAECWTAMCYFVKNLTKFLEGLCRVLTKILLLQHFLLVFARFKEQFAEFFDPSAGKRRKMMFVRMW